MKRRAPEFRRAPVTGGLGFIGSALVRRARVRIDDAADATFVRRLVLRADVETGHAARAAREACDPT